MGKVAAYAGVTGKVMVVLSNPAITGNSIQVLNSHFLILLINMAASFLLSILAEIMPHS